MPWKNAFLNLSNLMPLNREPIADPSTIKAKVERKSGGAPGVKLKPWPSVDENIPPSKKAAGNPNLMRIKPNIRDKEKRKNR